MEEGYINELKKEYNKYLMRWCKAQVYFDDCKIPVNEKEKWLPEIRNILDNLNRLLNTFDIYEVKYTTDQLFGGFDVEGEE